MLAHAPAALLRAADFLAAVKPHAIYRAELPSRGVPARGNIAGVAYTPGTPAWLRDSTLQSKMPSAAIHYDLACLVGRLFTPYRCSIRAA